MREAAIISGTEIVNVIVLADGSKGDVTLAETSGAVEITSMDPKPGMGNGWTYVDGEFVAPVQPDLPEVE
jgi:hypothetical protein